MPIFCFASLKDENLEAGPVFIAHADILHETRAVQTEESQQHKNCIERSRYLPKKAQLLSV
jgi:hypothetical protein